jgi:hypothetical protein
MILPVFFMLFVKGTSKVSRSTGSFFAQFLSNKEFRFINFVSELITWILIILVSWLLISAINKFVVGQASVVGSLKNMNPFNKEEAEAFEGKASLVGSLKNMNPFHKEKAEAFEGKSSLVGSLKNMNPFNKGEAEAFEGKSSMVGSLKNMNPFNNNKDDGGTFQETSAEAFVQQQKRQMHMQNAWNAEMYANENDASASASAMQQMHQLAASAYGIPKKAVTEETPMYVPEGFVEASTSGSGSGRGCSRDLAPF